MSYLEDLEKKKQQEGQITTNENGSLNTSGVVDSTITPGTAPAATEQKPGTGWVNLQQYLDVNKGQGANLASAASKGVTDAASQVNTQANDVKSQIIKDKQDIVGQGGTIKNKIAEDASSNFDTAKNFLGQTYDDTSKIDQLGADKGKVEDNLKNIDNADNIKAGLQSTYGSDGNYSQGFGLLDSFLALGDQSGRDKLNEIKTNTQKELDSTYGNATQAFKDTADTLGKQKDALVKSASTIKGGIEGQLQDKANDLTASVKDNEGVQAASIGDVLDKNTSLDLKALAELSGEAAKYGKTFDSGYAKPTPPPPPPPPAPPPPPERTVPTLPEVWAQTASDNLKMPQPNKDVRDGVNVLTKIDNFLTDPLGALSMGGLKTTAQDAWDNSLGKLSVNGAKETLGDLSINGAKTTLKDAPKAVEKVVQKVVPPKLKDTAKKAAEKAKAVADKAAAKAAKQAADWAKFEQERDAKSNAEAAAQQARDKAQEVAWAAFEKERDMRSNAEAAAQQARDTIEDGAKNLVNQVIKVPKIKAPKW